MTGDLNMGNNEITDVSRIMVDDEAYDATAWNGSLEVPTKNAVRDKVDAMDTAIGLNTAKVSYTDAAKVATIETNADVTDTANVTAAGALMDSEVTNLAQVKAFDTTDYATSAQGSTADSAVQDTGNETIAGVKTFSSSPIVPAPTTDLQASTKKYVDDNGGGGITWSAVTANTTMAVGTGSLANKATLLTLTLPATSAVGETVRVAGMNAGLWKVAQAANQYIKFGNQNTTTGTGGSLASVSTYDAVELVCIEANVGWVVVSSQGNITVT
jgi:hypothetical protein